MNLKDLIAKRAESNANGPKQSGGSEHKVDSTKAQSDVAKPALGKGLKLGGGAQKTGGLKLGNLPKPAVKPAVAKPDPMESLDLSSLASLDVSEIESAPAAGPAFPDEIEATAPARELSPDLTKQQLQFIESLDVIYTVLHDPDMLGQTIRSIMQDLQENPEFIQQVSDHDVHTMIKGIRSVMGIAKIRKEEKSTRRASGTKSKRSASSKYDADTMSQLDAMFAGMPSDD